MGPAHCFDFLASSAETMQAESIENFLQWASFYGFKDGAHPLRQIVSRIISFDVFNPSMLAEGGDSSAFFNAATGSHPEVINHPFCRHVFSRLHTLAHQQATIGVPHLPPAHEREPARRQRSPERPHEAKETSTAHLAKAIEHLAMSNKKRHKGILVEEPDSEDEDFDLPRALQNAGMSDLPADWLPSLRKIGRMDKLFQKAQASKPNRASTFISDTALDDWIPSWLGATRTPSTRTSLIKAWKKSLQDSQESSAFLSSSMSLWLTHAVLNIITFKDVFLHLLLLLRLIAEKDILYAVKYERHLQICIINHIRSSGDNTVASFLTSLQEKVAIDMDLDFTRRQVVTPPRKPQGGRKTSRSRSPPKLRPGPKIKASKEHQPKKKLICFHHDPANGITCPLGDKCPNTHLDTNEASAKERFDRARASFKGKVSS